MALYLYLSMEQQAWLRDSDLKGMVVHMCMGGVREVLMKENRKEEEEDSGIGIGSWRSSWCFLLTRTDKNFVSQYWLCEHLRTFQQEKMR